MVLKSVIIMRHAEREDRALEQQGIDWISTAPRPQDPVLSPYGIEQAKRAGDIMRSWGVTKILSSPMIRTVITSDIIAEQLGLGANSICVETGLVEEAKSFRGKTAAEPRPNWDPLVLPTSELTKYSTRLDTSYVPLMNVSHIRDEEKAPNGVREVHDTITERDEITKDRCRKVMKLILHSEFLDNEHILCVGHGATVGAFMRAFEEHLPEEFKIKGERSVSCFAKFVPFDEANPDGPWRATTSEWQSGNFGDSGEGVSDRG